MNELSTSLQKAVLQDMVRGLALMRLTVGAHYITSNIWREKAVGTWNAMYGAYSFLRISGDQTFDAKQIANNFHLECVEAFVLDLSDFWEGVPIRDAGYFQRSYGIKWDGVVAPLRRAVFSLPGYDRMAIGNQRAEVADQYMFLIRQLSQFVCVSSTSEQVSAQDLVSAAGLLYLPIQGNHHEETCRRREVLGC